VRNKLNFLRFVPVFLILPFLSISCGDKGDDHKEGTLLAPAITALSPESGKPGSVITITGSGFGTDKSNVNVRFNTTNATNIVSATDTRIEAEVPPGFSDQTVQVRVFVSGVASGGTAFYYMDVAPPSITSITATCFTGSAVVVSGNNFSVNKEDNIVKFGDAEATVTAATKTSLMVTAPHLGIATSADVTVTKSGMVSNARNITVDADQSKVAAYTWTTHTAKPGVVYKTGEFTLFGSTTRRIHILDVTLNGTNTLGIGVTASNDPPSFRNTVAICSGYAAIAGINAGYFQMSGTTNKDPYIRINGARVQDGHSGVSTHFTNAALLIHNNAASVRRLGTSGNNLNQVAAAIPVAQAEHVIVCGPMLITDGVIDIVNPTNSHNTSSTARTGLGVSADGKRVFMVVVDYNQGATGVSTPQLAKILQALGAVNAMNFDGGGSSTMFVQNQGTAGRVSVNGNSMRAVRSVIYVK
jgi:hypothetical protein